MGTYLNPGYERFQESSNSEIFVDKTEMISYINSVVNTNQKYLSVSRPRRFGKSMAANMLCAYYGRGSDNRALFEKFKIAKSSEWDKYLGKFDVIRLVMTDFIKEGKPAELSLAQIQNRVLDELSEAYPDVRFDPTDFYYSMDKFYRKSGIRFVIIIDEWDAIFREYKDDTSGQKMYLDFLRDWLKDQEYLALAYMTGILPIKKYGKHSALNMFQEFSMISPKKLAKYTGFTKEEVEEICAERDLNYAALKEWYDGYRLSTLPSAELVAQEEIERLKSTGEYQEYEIYSPLSVVNAAIYKQLENYWNKTETYEALAEYIRMDYDGLKEAVVLLMDSGRVKVDLRKYQNDMTTFQSKNDIFALLIHLGYLGYDSETGEVFIPNKEILDEFSTSTSSDEWVPAMEAFRLSQCLLQATWDCDEKKVAELLERAHDQAGNRTYNDEAALSYAVQLAYYSAQKYYTTVLELDAGKGYADIVYLPSPKYSDKPALLIELKYDKNTDTAIDQIHRQKYPDRLEHYKGNLLLVAVNYDKSVNNKNPEFKRHTCSIEKI